MIAASVFIVGCLMCGLGLVALIAANDAVREANRRTDTAKEHARRQKTAADYWSARVGEMYAEQQPARVAPISSAPNYDRITELLAANETARADWAEVEKWWNQ